MLAVTSRPGAVLPAVVGIGSMRIAIALETVPFIVIAVTHR
jgi:hypothetical protein